mgnify:CR=1 FL=1|tara:strand:+ start:1695 stop:1913 length:219 start_codon:yes stop_codon:yes gene_type:complete
MYITKSKLRRIINSILKEQFKFPLRYNHNGFELFSEDDSEELDEIWAAQGFDGDDERAIQGGMETHEEEMDV